VSKKPPELTWQDKAILVVIPVVVFVIFILANYLSEDQNVSSAFEKKMEKVVVRDGGKIMELIPPEQWASGTQKCILRSRDGKVDFGFIYNIQGSATMKFEIGKLIQFYGEYKYNTKGGNVEVPFKGKSGQWVGWAVYENRRYYSHQEANGSDHL